MEDCDKYDEQACSSFCQTAFGSASNVLNELYKELGVVGGGYEGRPSASNGAQASSQQISTSNDAISNVISNCAVT